MLAKIILDRTLYMIAKAIIPIYICKYFLDTGISKTVKS